MRTAPPHRVISLARNFPWRCAARPVGTKVAKALAHLKQAQAAFEAFALETQDKDAKSMYHDAGKATEVLANQLEQRLETIRDEEPAYRPNN
jgi:hypothetical protein